MKNDVETTLIEATRSDAMGEATISLVKHEAKSHGIIRWDVMAEGEGRPTLRDSWGDEANARLRYETSAAIVMREDAIIRLAMTPEGQAFAIARGMFGPDNTVTNAARILMEGTPEGRAAHFTTDKLADAMGAEVAAGISRQGGFAPVG